MFPSSDYGTSMIKSVDFTVRNKGYVNEGVTEKSAVKVMSKVQVLSPLSYFVSVSGSLLGEMECSSAPP